MKQIILSLIACVSISLTNCLADNRTVETRNATGYSAIRVDGVASIRFTQSDTYSCRVEGETEEVKELVTTVKGNTLIIDQRSDNKRQNIKGTTIYLSAPNLTRVKIDGVGTFKSEDPLKAEDIRFDIDGVGSLEIADLHCRSLRIDIDGVGKGKVNVYCDRLDAHADGVSSLKLSGKTRSANIEDGFLSKINTRRLKIESASEASAR